MKQDMITNWKDRLSRTLYFPDNFRLLFVSNAKAACSTIKKSIWLSSSPNTFTDGANPHDRRAGPFANNLNQARLKFTHLQDYVKFGVVRNPYSRFISAYQDKIQRPNRDVRVWKLLCDRYNLTRAPSAEDFLRILRDDDKFLIDQHFAPQSVNLSVGLINYDFIGQLEDIISLENFLRSQNIEVSSHSNHSTGAIKMGQVGQKLSGQSKELIKEIYFEDFKLFGYDIRSDKLKPSSPINLKPVDDEVLLSLLNLCTSVDQKVQIDSRLAIQRFVPNIDLTSPN